MRGLYRSGAIVAFVLSIGAEGNAITFLLCFCSGICLSIE